MRIVKTMSVIASLMLATVCLAQAPADAPAGSTGLCRDGTYWSGATKKGACHGHKGVQTWYGASTGAAAAAPAAATTAAPSGTGPFRGNVARRRHGTRGIDRGPASPSAASKSAPAPTVAQAPGGGPGLVWVNSSSKVYHCPSDRWYGKTKNGAYMSEADAIAQGNHADHGKACAK